MKRNIFIYIILFNMQYIVSHNSEVNASTELSDEETECRKLAIEIKNQYYSLVEVGYKSGHINNKEMDKILEQLFREIKVAFELTNIGGIELNEIAKNYEKQEEFCTSVLSANNKIKDIIETNYNNILAAIKAESLAEIAERWVKLFDLIMNKIDEIYQTHDKMQASNKSHNGLRWMHPDFDSYKELVVANNIN